MKSQPLELIVDVSDEEAPKPFELVLERIAQLNQGEYIRMLHRKQPLPLIQVLEKNGYGCKMSPGQQSQWEIIIWNKQDILADKFCTSGFINSP